MAFRQQDLSVLACANGFTLWHYKTPTSDDPTGEGYFIDARDLLRTNDIILIPPIGLFLCTKSDRDTAVVIPWLTLDALLQQLAAGDEELDGSFKAFFGEGEGI